MTNKKEIVTKLKYAINSFEEHPEMLKKLCNEITDQYGIDFFNEVLIESFDSIDEVL